MKNKKNDLKIWLSGSRGFIGSHLVSELRDTCELKCFTNGKQEKIEDIEDNEPICIDFQSKDGMHKAIEILGIPDIFIHLGWGDTSDPHSIKHLESNVLESKNLIREMYKAGLDKFIFLGSMNEYGDRLGSLYEDMGPNGWITNYAKGKIEVTKFGFEASKEMNKKFIHIRLFYTYGAVQKKGTLIQDMYHCYKNDTYLNLGPCEHYRDYIHISDVVKGIKLLCNVNESTTVNLGSGTAIKLSEFVNIFWKIMGGKPEKLHFNKKPQRKEQPQPYCFANLDKLKKLTEWEPSIHLEEGIRLTIKELIEYDKHYSQKFFS